MWKSTRNSCKGDQSPEWMLNPQVYQDIISKLKFDPKIDLFASRLNFQVKPFASFRPDPEASYIDAFSLNWGGLKFYAFPPFPKITLLQSFLLHLILNDGLELCQDFAFKVRNKEK